MQRTRIHSVLARLRRRNPQYSESSYLFLLAALHRCMRGLDRPRHVSGEELAGSARELALEQFGPLARTVLEHWGIHSTVDLGEIVFLLVESGVLVKDPGDSREDFHGLYSFEEAFEKEYPWGATVGGGRRSAD